VAALPSGKKRHHVRLSCAACRDARVPSGLTLARVSERGRQPSAVRWIAPFAVAVLVALGVVGVSAWYPLPIVVGAQPGPLIMALALSAALLVVALMAEPEVRKPWVGMSRRELAGLLAWWLCALLVAGLLWYGSWKAWSVVALLISIALLVKVLHIASHFELNVGFQLWMPFAAIMLSFAFLVAIGLMLGRTNLPPPIVSALDAYGPDEPSLAPPTRAAPDLSVINAHLQRSGDLALGGLPTTVFMYDFQGSGVDVYVANIGFPAPRGSVGVDDPPGWWTEVDGTALRSGPKGTNFLVVAWSSDVADRFAAALAEQLLHEVGAEGLEPPTFAL
jgi:hypothetical protein